MISTDLGEKAASAKQSKLPWPGPERATSFAEKSANITRHVVILVFSTHRYSSYWKQVPSISDSAKSVVRILPAQPGLLPPPIMSPKVPSHLQSTCEHAERAAKIAWLLESKRTNSTGEEIPDERLNRMYASGRRHYNQQIANSEVSAAPMLPSHSIITCVLVLPLR